jgi:hypothetical protein
MLTNPLAVPRAAFSPAPAAPPPAGTPPKQFTVTTCNLYSSVGLETNTRVRVRSSKRTRVFVLQLHLQVQHRNSLLGQTCNPILSHGIAIIAHTLREGLILQRVQPNRTIEPVVIYSISLVRQIETQAPSHTAVCEIGQREDAHSAHGARHGKPRLGSELRYIQGCDLSLQAV